MSTRNYIARGSGKPLTSLCRILADISYADLHELLTTNAVPVFNPLVGKYMVVSNTADEQVEKYNS